MEQVKEFGDFVIYQDKKLGNGCQGDVFKGAYKDDRSKQVAVKMIPIERFKKGNSNAEQYAQDLHREIQLLTKAGESPYLVNLIDVKRSKTTIYIFMKFADSGSLNQAIDNSGIIEEKQALKWFAHMLEGYKVLKLNNCIHRDIKPDNILLNEQNGEKIAMLADFGLGRQLEKMDEIQEITAIGTPLYRAPELLENQDFRDRVKVQAGNKCDVWSMGLVLFQMLHGELPWGRGCQTIANLLQDIQNRPLEYNDEDLSPETQDLLEKTLTINQEERISWEELFVHPAIPKI